MKYSVEQEIDLSRDRVVELLTNTENRWKWQNGYAGSEPIEGAPGAVGSSALLKFKFGPQSFELVETVLSKDLPFAYAVSYVSMASANISRNSFEELPGNRTLWRVDMELKLSGLQKLRALLSPGMFQQQTRKLMSDFISFAERSMN